MSIALESVRKTFGEHAAVDGVTLDIADGDFFVVLGPSGCGKTTLLRLIAGLEPLSAGRIAINGRSVAGKGHHVPPEDRNVGVVFQSYALWPHMSVRENVAFPVETAGIDRKTARARAEACLKTVALLSFADRRPASLSGGQRQRVALARCLAQQAETILMDEPLANLDPHLRGAMEEELAAFHRASRTTTLYITHDQREAMALADRMAVMWQGRVLQADRPEIVYGAPANERVARFVGRSAVVDADAEPAADGRAAVTLAGRRIEAGAAPGLCAGPVRLVIRPETARPVAAGEAHFEGRAERITYRGGFWEVHAAVDGLEEPLVLDLRDKVRPGDVLPIRLDRPWAVAAERRETRTAA